MIQLSLSACECIHSFTFPFHSWTFIYFFAIYFHWRIRWDQSVNENEWIEEMLLWRHAVSVTKIQENCFIVRENYLRWRSQKFTKYTRFFVWKMKKGWKQNISVIQSQVKGGTYSKRSSYTLFAVNHRKITKFFIFFAVLCLKCHLFGNNSLTFVWMFPFWVVPEYFYDILRESCTNIIKKLVCTI